MATQKMLSYVYNVVLIVAEGQGTIYDYTFC